MDTDLKRVTEAIELLSEHYDSVHIFCTRHEHDGTTQIQKGCGNFYARYGQIKEWTFRVDEEARENQRVYQRGEE